MIQTGMIVRLVGTLTPSDKGIVIREWSASIGWWEILAGGKVIHWPESQLEIINESR